MPSDDSDEDLWDESVSARNPKGKLRFLYGPWDPKSRRRYINSGVFFPVVSCVFFSFKITGPAPFTGETAKNYHETIAKAKLALVKANAGEEISDEKQLAALHKMTEQVSGKSQFGVQSDGFQLLRAYADPSNYKKNPCNGKKQVFKISLVLLTFLHIFSSEGGMGI